MRTIAYLFLLFTATSFAQNNVNAFQVGENLTFTASYNMSGLMADLSQIKMQTSEDAITEDEKFIEQNKQSEQEAIEELEEIDTFEDLDSIN